MLLLLYRCAFFLDDVLIYLHGQTKLVHRNNSVAGHLLEAEFYRLGGLPLS